MAAGLFIGCLPLYGAHFVLCMLVCLPLRLDLVVAYVAANISNPFIAPFLLTAEVEMGSLLLTGEHAALTLEGARATGALGYAAQAAVGSLVIGVVLAALGFVLAFALVKRCAASPLELSIQRTVKRYASAHPRDRAYVAVKLRTDPVLRQLQAMPGSFGTVLDAGCGRGQLSLSLLDLARADAVRGFDWDERKVSVARRAAHGEAEFTTGDLTRAEFGVADTILLMDVLHYLTLDEQDEVLTRAVRACTKSGRILVREADARAGFRSWLTKTFEHIGKTVGYNRGHKLSFRSRGEWLSLLESKGCRCEVVAPPEGAALSNVLIVATPHR